MKATEKENTIYEIIADGIVLANENDALELIANCSEQNTNKIVIHSKNIAPEFFDLKTKIAGNIIQKFINYNCQLDIIGDFDNIKSKSLRDFIYECNKTSNINFINKK